MARKEKKLHDHNSKSHENYRVKKEKEYNDLNSKSQEEHRARKERKLHDLNSESQEEYSARKERKLYDLNSESQEEYRARKKKKYNDLKKKVREKQSSESRHRNCRSERRRRREYKELIHRKTEMLHSRDDNRKTEMLHSRDDNRNNTKLKTNIRNEGTGKSDGCKSDIRHGSKLKNNTSSHTKFITDAKNNAKFTSNYKSKDTVYRNYRSEQLMRTRGVEKIIQEDQKRAKELTTIDKNIEDKILQKHETHANKTNNVYDCLNEFDEKVSLISDIDTALPKSHATEWSNGERQYNLTQKNHSVLHNGGIWKSITNEKV